MFLGRVLFNEMFESYRQSEILDQEEKDMQNICSTLSEHNYITYTYTYWS